MRLIDAEKILRDLTAMKTQYDAILIDGMIKGIEEAPTVDAAEVVRCKDCKHAWIHPSGYICCRRGGTASFDMTFEPDSFCSYGVRKEDK